MSSDGAFPGASRRAAVVFDFDGVIADTEGLHFAATRDVLAAAGRTLSESEYYDRYMGFDDEGLFQAFAEASGWAVTDEQLHDLVQRKVALFGERLDAGAVLYPGAAAAIARLGASFRLAIASGALSVEIERVLGASRLRPAFEVLVAAEHVERTKPAPDPYLAAIRGLGVPAADAVAIEDSRWGIDSARAAGLKTIGVITTSPASLLQGADAVVSSLDDITVEFVERLLTGD
jgi:HAD superfamily hydrolase (TIGR01509 family)